MIIKLSCLKATPINFGRKYGGFCEENDAIDFVGVSHCGWGGACRFGSEWVRNRCDYRTGDEDGFAVTDARWIVPRDRPARELQGDTDRASQTRRWSVGVSTDGGVYVTQQLGHILHGQDLGHGNGHSGESCRLER